MNKKQTKELKRQNAITKIKEWLKPNDTILIIQKSVSSSGMSRQVKVYNQRTMSNLTYFIPDILDLRYNQNNDCVSISGCGMDMHFWLSDALGHAIYGKKAKKMTSLNGNGSLLGCFKWRSI